MSQQPEPMTDERLAEIRARVEKAPPLGVWQVREDDESPGYYLVQHDGHPVAEVWGTPGWDDEQSAEFFAHAPTDIRLLLAEVERLRALLKDE